jgi:hypothetical protein
MLIKHKVLNRMEFKRNYYEDGRIRDIEISRADIEELIDKKEVWRTVVWLCNNVHHGCARFDFINYAIATKIAKRVLTGEEKKYVEEKSKGLFKLKERELLSYSTYEALKKYVFKCWKEFETYNMVTFTKVSYTKTFGRGRRRRTYTYKETAIKLTEKGKNVVV